MSNLTPLDVRNVAFKKPPLGKRGYDEEEVDSFLDAVERTISALTEEVASLRAQLGRGASPAAAGVASGSLAEVFAELERIKGRLARLEAAGADGGTTYRASDPLFGNRP
jgi:DivIVA domain-containing protein